jgi:outer membrane receptor protein involved in Fe transport
MSKIKMKIKSYKFHGAFILIIFFSNSVFAQKNNITLSGLILEKTSQNALPFVTISLKTNKEEIFVMGTVSDENGRYILSNVKPNTYKLYVTFVGFRPYVSEVYVGGVSDYLNLPTIILEQEMKLLNEVMVTAKQDMVDTKMDKKIFSIADNISQSGGSVLQAMQSLPSVSVENGKIQLRGNENVAVLIDGKQTALTGFGSQDGLDNLPASAIERIEIINNPSSKFDANGSAGIINIIYKKNKKEGFNGKIGFSGGLGALGIKQQNLPGIRPQYQNTPKINPSLTLNYSKNKTNFFFNTDYLYTETLNKNEFTDRIYDDGKVIRQQLKRNRNTTFLTTKTGLDYSINAQNTISVSGLFGTEKIIDRGDEPFFNANLTERLRLWQFLEDELKTTAMATATYQHKYTQPGKLLNVGFNYTFHREDEKYFFDNILPTFTGKDSFKLLSDEKVADLNIDYIKPLQYGTFETGLKLRRRTIPTNMQFFQGLNSPLDKDAGGKATYSETIPAIYSNYLFETKKLEAEIGLRIEYVKLNYVVDPKHNTYKSDGYNYTQPFPSVRLGFKLNENNKLTFFYNRRVDRPNEVDIRIFPKYDDAEIVKVGNPALKPQFTNTLEMGFKTNITNGYFYSSLYHRVTDGSITRISSSVPGSTILYAIFQNAGKSSNSGFETILSKELSKSFSFTANMNIFQNKINEFTVNNLYPKPNTFTAEAQKLISGNAKLNVLTHFKNKLDWQISAIYLAPDLIPQGKIGARFSLDTGLKKTLKNGKNEITLNATDLLNTMITNRQISGRGFSYTSKDYFETQVVRLGYCYKF